MSQNPRKAKSDTEEYRKTKEQMVKVAAELIEEVGYKRLKFDELATRLSCNRATIYRYFDSKQELLESVMLMLMTEVTQQILDDVAGTQKVTTNSFATVLHEVIETLRGEARYAIIMVPDNVKLFRELTDRHYGELISVMLQRYLEGAAEQTPLRQGVDGAKVVPWLMHQIVSYSFLGVPGETAQEQKDFLESMVVSVIIE